MAVSEIASESTASAKTGSARAFVRHFFEMLIAMMLGMFLLAGVWQGIWSLAGGSDLFNHVVPIAILMPIDMTLGMTVIMRYRGHRWRLVGEMALAMCLPFIVLLIPYAAGVGDRGMVLGGGHMFMLLLMIVAMLVRYGEYSQDHRHHAAHGHEAHATSTSA